MDLYSQIHSCSVSDKSTAQSSKDLDGKQIITIFYITGMEENCKIYRILKKLFLLQNV
jgi:hypothetical protein